MPRSREKIAKIIQSLGNIFSTQDAALLLQRSNIDTSKVLSRWVQQGWLTRIRRGLYAVVPLDATDNKQMLEEPWVLIPEIYAPCYIGGWSATEYWDLTEQLFYDICVFTEKPILHKKQTINRISFLLTHISSQQNFGTTVVWKQNKKIFISDPHKTIIDGMYNPLSFGGIQHLIDCLREYIKSSHHDPKKLAVYASRMNSGAVFKRLGYLYSEITKGESQLTDLCHKNLTQGIAALDPSIKSGSITTRWRLKVPKHLTI